MIGVTTRANAEKIHKDRPRDRYPTVPSTLPKISTAPTPPKISTAQVKKRTIQAPNKSTDDALESLKNVLL
jgi:hypothetical protein